MEQISEQEKLTGIEKGFAKWRSLYFKEDITIFTVWKKNIKYARQKLLELQVVMDESTIIVGDFTISLSEMDQYTRQKISKDIFELNSNINQLDMIDTSSSNNKDYIFFSRIKIELKNSEKIQSSF